MSNEVCYKSCSLHKVYTSPSNVTVVYVLIRTWEARLIRAPCNVSCPGNSSQFCGGDSWYTFHLMYLWVALVKAICSGMLEPVENNMPTSTTICLDDFNEIVSCISTCHSGQHLASNEPVCDLLLRKFAGGKDVLRLSVLASIMSQMREVQSLCQEGTE